MVRDNTSLAKLLLESSREYRPFHQLGLDMLHRSNNEDIVLEYVKFGGCLEASTELLGPCPMA